MMIGKIKSAPDVLDFPGLVAVATPGLVDVFVTVIIESVRASSTPIWLTESVEGELATDVSCVPRDVIGGSVDISVMLVRGSEPAGDVDNDVELDAIVVGRCVEMGNGA